MLSAFEMKASDISVIWTRRARRRSRSSRRKNDSVPFGTIYLMCRRSNRPRRKHGRHRWTVDRISLVTYLDDEVEAGEVVNLLFSGARRHGASHFGKRGRRIEGSRQTLEDSQLERRRDHVLDFWIGED